MSTEDKYIACMLLHAVGDTVGYKNSLWEFKKGTYEKTLEKVYEFIDLGGVTNISLKNWNVSDDTILHMKTCDALIQNWSSLNSYGTILKENYIQALKQFEEEGYEMRYPGKTTLESLKRLKDGGHWYDTPYNIYSGGSGASMRSLCIGLAFHGQENRDKLIQFAIESSRITHNSTVGYLGGFASALFAALAMEGIHIYEWPFILLDMINSKQVYRYIKSTVRDVESYVRDHHVFVDKWVRYTEDKFDQDKKPVKRKATINLVLRGQYYKKTFGFDLLVPHEKTNEGSQDYFLIGSGGDDSVIIAYDALLDAGDNWEKLIYYAMLHMGDTDTTGCIAAGLYGILYGMTSVPKKFLEHLEYKKEITELGKQLYKKFHKST